MANNPKNPSILSKSLEVIDFIQSPIISRLSRFSRLKINQRSDRARMIYYQSSHGIAMGYGICFLILLTMPVTGGAGVSPIGVKIRILLFDI